LYDHADACGMEYFVFSPCRRHLVAGGDHGMVQIWFNVIDGDNSTMRTNRLKGLQATVKSVTFSPDGQYVAALDAIGIIMIWKVDSVDCHSRSMSVTNNNDATQFSTAPCTLVRYQNANVESVCSTSHRDASRGKASVTAAATGVVGAHSIAFTPDSSMLSAASTDGKVRFWSRTSWGSNPSSLLYFWVEQKSTITYARSIGRATSSNNHGFSTFCIS
jgi:WD40 repeat protein